MASFIFYDLAFLVLFTLAVVLFLYKRKKNVERKGIIFLYKSNLGIKLMDSFSKKYRSILKPLEYLVIFSGVFLMVNIVWLIIESVYLYLKFPITQVIKAPPIAPLIPYFPKLFGLESFFPPLYFTYFIVAVAIGGVLHELAHGVFARLNNFKVRSTGFLFIGPLLGAFVEPDEQQMAKAKKRPQLAVLAAGTFANVLIALLFGVLLVAFFSATTTPAGIGFSDYSTSVVNLTKLNIPENLPENAELIELTDGEKTYLANPLLVERALSNGQELARVYDNAPAIQNQLQGAIMEINGIKITNFEELTSTLSSHNPGDEVKIKTALKSGVFDTTPEFKEYEFSLGEREGKAFLGIATVQQEGGISFRGLFSFIFSGAGTLDPQTYYESSLGSFGWFVYFLLWWTFLINVLLALFNMLPVGPLDGGKFLELGIAAIFKSDKAGKKVSSYSTKLILLMLLIMMVKWFLGFF